MPQAGIIFDFVEIDKLSREDYFRVSCEVKKVLTTEAFSMLQNVRTEAKMQNARLGYTKRMREIKLLREYRELLKLQKDLLEEVLYYEKSINQLQL